MRRGLRIFLNYKEAPCHDSKLLLDLKSRLIVLYVQIAKLGNMRFRYLDRRGGNRDKNKEGWGAVEKRCRRAPEIDRRVFGWFNNN